MSTQRRATGSPQEGIPEVHATTETDQPARRAGRSTVWAAPESLTPLEDEHGLGRARPGGY